MLFRFAGLLYSKTLYFILKFKEMLKSNFFL
jgi:hypothetical protein